MYRWQLLNLCVRVYMGMLLKLLLVSSVVDSHDTRHTPIRRTQTAASDEAVSPAAWICDKKNVAGR